MLNSRAWTVQLTQKIKTATPELNSVGNLSRGAWWAAPSTEVLQQTQHQSSRRAWVTGILCANGKDPARSGRQMCEWEKWQFWKWRSLTPILSQMVNPSLTSSVGQQFPWGSLHLFFFQMQTPKLRKGWLVKNQIIVKYSRNWSKDVPYLILKMARACDEKLKDHRGLWKVNLSPKQISTPSEITTLSYVLPGMFLKHTHTFMLPFPSPLTMYLGYFGLSS